MLSKYIKNIIFEIGFDVCGIAKIDVLHDDLDRLNCWLADGCNAEMEYMRRNTDKRANPLLLLDNAQSIVVMLMNYRPLQIQAPDAPQIAYYAYGKDYHKYINEKLNNIICLTKTAFPHVNMRGFVDTAPVFEKTWAMRAGLGWIGKNNLLISPVLGSFTFIAVLLVDAVLEYDIATTTSRCGTCTRCLDACPTQALKAYRLDANRCISYYNKRRNESALPLHGYCFGCDYCQRACIWNVSTPAHRQAGWTIRDIVQLSADEWQQMDETFFTSVFAESPLRDTGFTKLKSNINRCNYKQK